MYIGFGKHCSVVHRKLAYFKVFRTYTAYGRRIVVIACNELSGGGDVGADGGQEVRLVAQRLVVGKFQGLHGAGVLTDAAAHIRSRMDHYHVGAHFGDLRLDTFL